MPRDPQDSFDLQRPAVGDRAVLMAPCLIVSIDLIDDRMQACVQLDSGQRFWTDVSDVYLLTDSG